MWKTLIGKMTNKSKAKGTAAETAVVKTLRAHGFSAAERRALTGSLDQGDITGIPGVCIEVKASSIYAIPEWMRELATETRNASADIGALVIKPRGVGTAHAAEWWAVMPLSDLTLLLRAAGYGDSIPD